MNTPRADFPALAQPANGHPLVYLDSAATTMRPLQVLEAVNAFYTQCGANPHRGVYGLGEQATLAYETARETVAQFIGAANAQEVIFTRNATEALNLLAYSFAPTVLTPGDEIVIPVSEHHSNLVPWQQAAAKANARLVYLYPDENGNISEEEIQTKITPRTKIVAFAQVSNVLGNILPLQALVRRAKEVGAATVLDCAQSVPHFRIDMGALEVDFAAFSGHKLYAPMGIGVLYGRRALLESMPPFLTGGDMIEYVQEQHTTFAPPPQKFEAGTQNAGGAIGLAAAIRYIEHIGWPAIQATEHALVQKTLAGLAQLPYIHVLGDTRPGTPRCGVISFTIEGVHPHDAATILDAEGIAIRAGHHCAQPLLRFLGLNASCRASFGLYNTEADVDALLRAIPNTRRMLGYAD